MRPFHYEQANDLAAAVRTGAAGSSPALTASSHYLAGGTTLLDLMKLDVMRPESLVDIRSLQTEHASILQGDAGLHLGALVRMADAAAHPIVRGDYPAIAQSLDLAASPQIRNMATLAGNVLQRSRCSYFRDTHWPGCNKRNPGSGCDAIGGANRQMAVLGTSSSCIAAYPGDLAVALAAFEAEIDIVGKAGKRHIAFSALHKLPGDTPDIETSLQAGDVITGFVIPPFPGSRRSIYVKVRDRDSYQFALASAAVALDLENGVVRQARIAVGGVATTPWRAAEAEQSLRGKRIDSDTASAAGVLAFAGAIGAGHNEFKCRLGPVTVAKALLAAARLEI